jgi:hypothetical protein
MERWWTVEIQMNAQVSENGCRGGCRGKQRQSAVVIEAVEELYRGKVV